MKSKIPEMMWESVWYNSKWQILMVFDPRHLSCLKHSWCQEVEGELLPLEQLSALVPHHWCDFVEVLPLEHGLYSAGILDSTIKKEGLFSIESSRGMRRHLQWW